MVDSRTATRLRLLFGLIMLINEKILAKKFGRILKIETKQDKKTENLSKKLFGKGY